MVNVYKYPIHGPWMLWDLNDPLFFVGFRQEAASTPKPPAGAAAAA